MTIENLEGKTNVLHANVGIDLGAKNTGVFIECHRSSEPDKFSSAAFTVVMPPDQTDFTYRLTSRTQARHRVRGGQRFSLARRLLKVLIEEMLRRKNETVPAPQKTQLWDALYGLLKRRGYSRVDSETDLSSLTEISDTEAFLKIFEEVFGIDSSSQLFSHLQAGSRDDQGNDVSPEAFWNSFKQNIADVEELSAAFAKLPDRTALKKAVTSCVKNDFPDLDPKLYLNAVISVVDDTGNLLLEKKHGHKSRREYIEVVLKEIEKDRRLWKIAELAGGKERLANLVCNVSNLQLRALRWYFNDQRFKGTDFYDGEKLKSVLVSAYRYFHPDDDRRQDMKDVISEYSGSGSIIDTMSTLDPRKSIPPYEDQNNRRPPADATLLLNPAVLNTKAPEWMDWAGKISEKYPVYAYETDFIARKEDRVSRINAKHGKLSDNFYQASYILQRIFDRNTKTDPFRLRENTEIYADSGLKSFDENNIGFKELSLVLGGNSSAVEFLKLAFDYYEETSAAKDGCWQAEFNMNSAKIPLLEKSGAHPPMKKSVLDILIGNILGADREIGRAFISSHVMDEPVEKRLKVKSICGKAADLLKKYGNGFKYSLEQAQEKNQQSKVTADEKELLTIDARSRKAAAVISEKLNLSPAQLTKFSNPFSLAQIYNLLNNDPDGFTGTCLAVHFENMYRMKTIEEHKGVSAEFSRLPADCVKPFDGILRRSLERVSFETAKRVAEEIKNTSNASLPVDVTIVVESNSFTFSADLAEIKNASKKIITQIAEKGDAENKRWADKDERIKQASKGICPYTGSILLPTDQSGEIDHIIPRALSGKNQGMIFNSEANLIFVSRKGNQNKKDQLYTLSNLNRNYLRKQFNTDDINLIESEIKSKVKALKENGRLKRFELMSEDEQKYVRHALFLKPGDEARREVERSLGRRNQTLVNGTQQWFAGTLVENIKRILSDNGYSRINFSVRRMPAEGTSDCRRRLSEIDSQFTKPASSEQPFASHAIDALCVYAGACDVPEIRSLMGGAVWDDESDESIPSQLVNNIFPRDVDCIHVERKPLAEKGNFWSRKIFNDGIYQLNFVPVLRKGNDLRIGFKIPSANSPKKNFVKGKNPLNLIELLKDVLSEPVKADDSWEKYEIVQTLAFEKIGKAMHSFVSEDELNAVKVILSLSYITQKTSVVGKLYDSQKHKLKPIEEKSFHIKPAFSSKALGFSYGCDIVIPVFNDWQRISELDEIRKLFGQEKVDQNTVEKVIKKYWPDRKVQSNVRVTSRPHSAYRQAISLPMKAATGACYAVRRKNLDGTPIYQVIATLQNSSGFAADQGRKVDWKSPVLLDGLKAENIIPLKEERLYREDSVIVPLTEFRNVFVYKAQKHENNDSDQFSISIAPGTEGRRYLKISCPFSIFRKAAGLKNEDGFTQLKNEMKAPEFFIQKLAGSLKNTISDSGAAVAEADKIPSLLGKPRSNLFILSTGNQISFWYIVESSNEVMNSMFNDQTKS